MTHQSQAAREYAEAMLDNWREAGGDTSALINELARIIIEIREQVNKCPHT